MKRRSQILRAELMQDIAQGFYPPDQPLPSLKQLARTFGVSLSTAQEAIRLLQDEGVVESTRRKGTFVRYPLSPRSRGKAVALLFAREEEYLAERPYPHAAVEGLRRQLAEDGRRLVPLSLLARGLDAVLADLGKRPWAGAVLFEVESYRLLQFLQDQRLPAVSMDYDTFRLGVSSAAHDNLRAGFLAGRQLAEAGHREVALLAPLYSRPLKIRGLGAGNVLRDPVEDDRIRGFEWALREAGGRVRLLTYAAPEQIRQLEGLFARRPAPSAVACLSDRQAARVAEDLGKMGLRIPDHVSLVALGGLGGSAHLPDAIPDISGVRLDHERLGQSAGEILRDAISGLPARRVILPIAWEAGRTLGPTPIVQQVVAGGA